MKIVYLSFTAGLRIFVQKDLLYHVKKLVHDLHDFACNTLMNLKINKSLKADYYNLQNNDDSVCNLYGNVIK